MPTMRDVRGIMDAQDANFRCGTLTAPLFVLLIGRVAETGEKKLREKLTRRWSNANEYLFMASVRSGNQDLADGTSYTINGAAIAQRGQQQLYWALSCIVGSFLDAARRGGVALADSRLVAVVGGDEETALWAAPALAILTDKLYDLGGNVSDRSVYAYMSAYDPANAPVLSRVRADFERWTREVPAEPMRYVEYPDRTWEFLPCNGYITDCLFDRVVCLSRQTDNGKSYDSNGGRNDLLGALIDPASGIVWPDSRVCSGFVYPDSVEPGVDVLIAWRQAHDRFVSEMDRRGPDTAALDAVNAPLYKAMTRACNAVARSMHGFCIYDDKAMQEFLEGWRKNRRAPSEAEVRRLFGAALENKYDYLWRQVLSGEEVTAVEAGWRSAVREWFSGVWSYSALSKADCCALGYQLESRAREVSAEPGGQSDAADVIRMAVEKHFSPGRRENQRKVDEHLEALEQELREEYRRRCAYLYNLEHQHIREFDMQICNMRSEFANDLRLWSQNPEALIDKRAEVINVGDALDAEYERAINNPDLDAGLLEFLSAAAQWLEEQHFPRTPIPEPDDNMKRIACHMKVRFAAVGGVCRRIAGGQDAGRYYYIHGLTLDNIQEFGD